MQPNTFNFQVGFNLTLSLYLKAAASIKDLAHNYTFANILMLTHFLVGITVLRRCLFSGSN